MLRSIALTAFMAASSVLAVKCSDDSKCPKDSPCCSQYGECGVGAFCLGGCDPKKSHSLDSCAPAPVCQDRKLTFENLDGITDIGKYLGDADEADWVSEGETAHSGDNVLLTMPKGSTGTVLSSTVYMWYGNVKARLKTSRGPGVITAFILFSDVQDEIDYEFVGVDLETAQTNYYFQGNLDWTNSKNLSMKDSFAHFHDYEIRWTPDKIEWLIDGDVGRTKERSDTWNKTGQHWEFPQTPARVQLSLWPGGDPSNPKGTIDWAGGEIDWDAKDIKDSGYFYVTVESVEIECYDGKDGVGTHSGKSYTYDDTSGTNDTVVDGDKDTVLGSLQATGLNMDKGKDKDDDDDDDDDNSNTIPGGNSSGNDHTGGGGSGGDGSDSSGSDSADDWQNFDQGNTEDGSGGSGAAKSSASALAMIIAGCALFWL